MAINRSDIVEEFNYGKRILKIVDLEQHRDDLRHQLDNIDAQIKKSRDELPAGVVELYDEYRTCLTLRGEKMPAADQWESASITQSFMDQSYWDQRYQQQVQQDIIKQMMMTRPASTNPLSRI